MKWHLIELATELGVSLYNLLSILSIDTIKPVANASIMLPSSHPSIVHLAAKRIIMKANDNAAMLRARVVIVLESFRIGWWHAKDVRFVVANTSRTEQFASTQVLNPDWICLLVQKQSMSEALQDTCGKSSNLHCTCQSLAHVSELKSYLLSTPAMTAVQSTCRWQLWVVARWASSWKGQLSPRV